MRDLLCRIYGTALVSIEVSGESTDETIKAKNQPSMNKNDGPFFFYTVSASRTNSLVTQQLYH